MSDVNVTLGPGRYFIGDISFAVEAKIRNRWNEDGRPNGEVEVGKSKFVVCATDSGNGNFCDFDGHSYVVRDGNIGLVPESLWDPKEAALGAKGKIVEAKEQVVFDVEDGIYYVTVDDDEPIEIDTESDEDYDDDDEEWLDEDEQF